VINVSGKIMSVAKFVQYCAAALSVISAPCAAQAADFYGGYKDQPVYVQPLPWQGFYLGGYLGGAWSSIEPANNVVILGGGGTIPIRSINNSGFIGGFQLGYNVQAGNFFYGIEADFGGMDASASQNFIDPITPARVLSIKSSGGFYGDITGRAGVVLGGALLYAKGGFAFFTGDFRITDSFDNIRQDSGTFTGWTIGGGVEYLIAPQWTVKVEYQYFDFNNNNFSCCNGAATGRIENGLTSSSVKLGFNFFVHTLRSPIY
jgi:outer membrane immunogenic protein